jgi:hypothetical protein
VTAALLEQLDRVPALFDLLLHDLHLFGRLETAAFLDLAVHDRGLQHA